MSRMVDRIGGSSPWKQFACCCRSKSNFQRTSSSCAVITSAPRSTASMASTTSASGGTTSRSGRPSQVCVSVKRDLLLVSVKRDLLLIWKTLTDCFNCLPVAAIIDEKIFCMHGGLSPDLNSMEQIRRIMRPTDVPDTGERERVVYWYLIQ